MKISFYILLLFFSVQSFGQKKKDTDSVSIKGLAIKNLFIRDIPSIEKYPKPIYVVDGVIVSVEQLKKINPELIESITILKDSVAKNHFSGQARNGVIVIKTKKLSKRELRKMKKNKN